MKIILISNPVDIQKEHELIEALFEKGLDYFHLRKPDHQKSDFENFLKKIKPSFYKKISIHSHYDFIGKYNLRGIHLPEKIINEPEVKELIKTVKKRNLTVSSSIHSVFDIKECNKFDYIFLSPVFDSISKPDYHSKIDLEEFKKLKSLENIKPKVIALGGIDINNIQKISEVGFDGHAILGAIWKDFEKDANIENAIDKFLKIKLKVSELSKIQ